MENLITFAAEINKDWTPNYKAEVKNGLLVVSYEKYDESNTPEWVECAYLSENLKISGTDEDAMSQLEFMIRR
jgi:hypothetical protein